MSLRFSVVAFILFLASGAQANNPKAADITELKDKLIVLEAGPDLHLLLVPTYAEGKKSFFYGRKGVFHRQRIYGASASASASGKTKFEFTLWNPRGEHRHGSSLGFKDGKFTVSCDDRITELKPLSKEAAKVVIAAGRFFEAKWTRQSFALARDEHGIYYFVDRHREKDSRDFRVFRGPRGKVSRLRMRNIVYDSAGTIFSTTRGQLRLVLDKKAATWIRGKKRTELVYLPIYANRRLIYNELGMYTDERLGTPCDDL
jgi:hypothetical protein